MIGAMQRRYQQFIHFFKDHTGGDGQQALASVSILGTTATLLLLTFSLASALLLTDSLFPRLTLPYVAAATFAVGILYLVDKKKLITFGGVLLIFIYVLLGAALMHRVGVGGAAIIMFSVAVILASSMYGFWFALVPTEIIAAALIGFRASELQGSVQPVYVFIPQPTSFDSVVALIILLNALVVACGVVHRYLLQVNQRLQASEAEKFRHLYRFAEIGEVSTALIHDLANTLSSLNLEIEDIKPQVSSQAFTRVTKKVRQLNKVLNTAREKMNGRHSRETFDIGKEITQTVASLQIVARKARVTLDWTRPSGPIPYFGEKILLQQVLAILIKNAIDSYPLTRGSSRSKRHVDILLLNKGNTLVLTITDGGKGIKPAQRDHVFEPFYSTKKDGMGMGLYLTKRFIEDSFGGTITLQTLQKKTIFSINLPKSKKRRSIKSS